MGSGEVEYSCLCWHTNIGTVNITPHNIFTHRLQTSKTVAQHYSFAVASDTMPHHQRGLKPWWCHCSCGDNTRWAAQSPQALPQLWATKLLAQQWLGQPYDEDMKLARRLAANGIHANHYVTVINRLHWIFIFHLIFFCFSSFKTRVQL